MRLGISGTRTFNDYQLLSDHLQSSLATEIIVKTDVPVEHIDKLIYRYASEHKIKTTVCTDSDDFVALCQHLIAFWDGISRGTARSLKRCKELKTPITIIWIE